MGYFNSIIIRKAEVKPSTILERPTVCKEHTNPVYKQCGTL